MRPDQPPGRAVLLGALTAGLALLWGVAYAAVDAPVCGRGVALEWLPCLDAETGGAATAP
ncbi:hypothetical protein NJC10_01000 [Micrococcus sp. M4NT]|uniref:hypothetical protein n=1 Tax=Micrococcus sp. M4NT TaxID=2957501 RepID=UPI0029A2B1C8|nr:hypothetical protein [Micrococcus sp. M4NT]MDX2340257.1 hypothetical protein [Micrococcus sp. M4NT]